MGGLTVIFGKPLLGIFTSAPEVIKLGALRMNIMMCAFFTFGMMNVFPGLTRVMGYSIMPMIATLVCACLMRIVCLLPSYLGTGGNWTGSYFLLCKAQDSQVYCDTDWDCGDINFFGVKKADEPYHELHHIINT